MKDEFVKNIGIWGCGCLVDTSAAGRSTDRAGRRDQRHYNYLKRKSPTVINTMRMKGTLEQYLQDVDRDAEEMFSQLVKQLAEKDGITGTLKATNQMEWVRQMNSIRTQATELVNKELIFI